MKKTKLPYDKNSAISIYEYSKEILGCTLRKYIYDGYEPKKGKGSLGQMVENLFFLLDTNSNPNPDFQTAGLELKCTPLKLSKDNHYLIKERLSCNLIDYCKVVNEKFEESHFYLKCQLMLLLFYLYKKDYDNLDLEFIYSVLWMIPEKDLVVIKQDYITIIDKIKAGKAHLLSEGDTMYLAACRKGQKGEKLTSQPYSEIGAARRSFCLKMAYMRTILTEVQQSKSNAISNFEIPKFQLVSREELLADTFDNIIYDRVKSYIGKDYQIIAKELNLNLSNNPKNKFAIIANAIVSNNTCFNVNLSEEFKKAGLTMKTIRVKQNGTIKEAMSFENLDYIEIAECENWYDSRLYELFSSRFMFVVYREKNLNKEDYVLDNVFFWTMPQDDLIVAEKYWKHIRKNVLENKISAEYWWKQKDRKKFHVRPKARNSSDLAITITGDFAKKYCYWFNNEYVKQIINSYNGTK